MPRLYRITPTPCIDIDFGTRPYFFYYSLCINYSLCNDFFKIIIITIISSLHYLLCTGKMIRVGQYRQLGVLTYHVTSAGRGASSTLHYPMPGTSASLCRPALTVLCHHFGVPSSLLRHLGPARGWNLVPHQARTASLILNTLTS